MLSGWKCNFYGDEESIYLTCIIDGFHTNAMQIVKVWAALNKTNGTCFLDSLEWYSKNVIIIDGFDADLKREGRSITTPHYLLNRYLQK